MSGPNSVQSLFKSYYTLTQSDLQQLWANCFFALDSNVLLNLYRFPIGARKDLLGVLNHFKERLWLPHQVALEYQRNRARVLAEQVGRFGSVIAAIGKVESTLQVELEKLQLRKRHSMIDPDILLSTIRSAVTTARETLETQRQAQEKDIEDDPVRPEIEALFGENVGQPFSIQILNEVYKEGVTRYQHNRAPGFMDQGKAKEPDAVYYFDGVPIHAQFGDLLVWKQLLVEAKQRKVDDLILVTDDDKEDWWFESSGRRFGPRPELAEEARIEAGVERFHMYSSERFMEYAREHLGLTIQPDSIRQIREAKVARKRVTDPIRRMHAFEEWLLTSSYFAGANITKLSGEHLDFIVRDGSKTHGIIIVPQANDHRIHVGSRRAESAGILTELTDIIVFIGSRNSLRFKDLRTSPLLRTLRTRAIVVFVHFIHRSATNDYTIGGVETLPI